MTWGVDYQHRPPLPERGGRHTQVPGPEKLVSWIGLAHRVRQSGEKLRSGAMTKEGSLHVRWALVQAVGVAVRWDSASQRSTAG